MNKLNQNPMRFQATLDGQTVSVNSSKMVVQSIISTPTPDRVGDVVLPQGLMNREQFLQNPVVLWAHQRMLPPIGMCQYLDVSSERILAETKFSASSPLAVDLFRLYEEGILRAWSIGFLPRRSTPLPRRGLLIEQWELLEYSAVPIPENPQALTLAIRKGFIHDPAFLNWASDFAKQDVLDGLLVA